MLISYKTAKSWIHEQHTKHVFVGVHSAKMGDSSRHRPGVPILLLQPLS